MWDGYYQNIDGLKMLLLWNHLLLLDDNRLTKHIFEWEYANTFGNKNSWIHDIKQFLQLVDKEDNFNNLIKVDLKYLSLLLLWSANGNAKYK